MKSTTAAAAFGFILLISLDVLAQNKQTSDDNLWGVEFNVVWPFVPGVEIYTGKATRTVWESRNSHGDLTFGFLLRPGTSEDENAEEFSEYGVNIGYRHYFFKGFHAELALYPSFARETNNNIDSRDYDGFAMTTEFYTGAKIDVIKKTSYSFYVMPQAGIGYNVISNLGPETEGNAPFPTLNLQLGLSF
jgi:hypothetical protein